MYVRATKINTIAVYIAMISVTKTELLTKSPEGRNSGVLTNPPCYPQLSLLLRSDISAMLIE